jgi:hypothetical protein
MPRFRHSFFRAFGSMLHPLRHRVARLLLAAGYLAANVLGGWVHDHADHAAEEKGSGVFCRESAEKDSRPLFSALFSAAGVVALTADDAAHGAHDDDCTVCRTAGQRVLQAPGFQPDGVHAVSAQVAAVLPANPIAPLARSIHSRAPPLGV